MLTDGAVCLLAEHGVTGLTFQALADWVGVTRPALNQRLSRAALQELVARRYADRWVTWTSRYVTDHAAQELITQEWDPWPEGWGLVKRVFAMLPETDDEVAGLRAWHALGALGVTVPSVASAVADADRAERRMVGVAAPWMTDADVAVVDAVVRGLRVRMSAPEDRLSAQHAQRTLLCHLALLRGSRCATVPEEARS